MSRFSGLMDSATRHAGIACTVYYNNDHRMVRGIMQYDVRSTYVSRYNAAQKKVVDQLGVRADDCAVVFISYRKWLDQALSDQPSKVTIKAESVIYRVLASMVVKVRSEGLCHWCVIKPIGRAKPTTYYDLIAS